MAKLQNIGRDICKISIIFQYENPLLTNICNINYWNKVFQYIMPQLYKKENLRVFINLM